MKVLWRRYNKSKNIWAESACVEGTAVGFSRNSYNTTWTQYDRLQAYPISVIEEHAKEALKTNQDGSYKVYESLEAFFEDQFVAML